MKWKDFWLGPEEKEEMGLDDFGMEWQQISQLPAREESQLKEIKSPQLLGSLVSLFEAAAAGGTLGLGVKAARNLASGGIYKLIMPQGLSADGLASSSTVEGAVRGIVQGTAGKVVGQASFMPLDFSELLFANGAVAAVQMAAMVISQVYLEQISAQLESIDQSLKVIERFQETQFQSRILSLMAQVGKLSEFHLEILANEDQRRSQLHQLNTLEAECTQLLGQASLNMKDVLEKKVQDFDAYQMRTKEIQRWEIVQKALWKVLNRLAELRYVFSLGRTSRQQCMALLEVYGEQTAEVHQRLHTWHEEATQRLGVIVSKRKRRRNGMDAAVFFLGGLVNEDLNFVDFSQELADMIREQSSFQLPVVCDLSTWYEQPAQLVFKEQTIFYLPPEASKNCSHLEEAV